MKFLSLIFSCLLCWSGLAQNDLADPQFVARLGAPTVDLASNEVDAWVARVVVQGSTVSPADKALAYAFVSGLYSYGIRTNAYRVGIYLGDTIAALNAPLINDMGAATDALTGFVSGDYTTNGLSGGSGKHINTGFAPSNPGSLLAGYMTNFSLGVYARTTGANGVQIGMNDYPFNSLAYIALNNGGSDYCLLWSGNPAVNDIGPYPDADGRGDWLATKTGTVVDMYRHGVSIGHNASAGVGAPGSSDGPIYVHDGWIYGAANWAPSSMQICFYWIGSGLTATQSANLHTLVQAVQVGHARDIP